MNDTIDNKKFDSENYYYAANMATAEQNRIASESSINSNDVFMLMTKYNLDLDTNNFYY